jgi:hypothetical protein
MEAWSNLRPAQLNSVPEIESIRAEWVESRAIFNRLCPGGEKAMNEPCDSISWVFSFFLLLIFFLSHVIFKSVAQLRSTAKFDPNRFAHQIFEIVLLSSCFADFSRDCVNLSYRASTSGCNFAFRCVILLMRNEVHRIWSDNYSHINLNSRLDHRYSVK